MSKSNRAIKTNAVRLLESESILYELIEYDISDGQIDGVSVAEKTNQALETVFKTLVTTSLNREMFVFLVPVNLELDVKKAAKAANVKKLDMLPLKDLTKETGYVQGGCSAIGMKRKLPTFIDQSALNLNDIIVSAGRPGLQMKLQVKDLESMTGAEFKDIVKK